MRVRTTAAGVAGASGFGTFVLNGRSAFMTQALACSTRTHLRTVSSLIPAKSCTSSRPAQGPSDKPRHRLRHYSSNTSSTVSSASSRTSKLSRSAFQYDQPFLDLVISRLKDQSDTSAYFKNCKDKALRQAGVFMVSGEQGTGNGWSA